MRDDRHATSEHWTEIHRTRAADQVSWFQEEPVLSLRLLIEGGLTRDSSVVDVGGGSSNLVDHLLRHGVTDVSVVDIAGPALELARNRLGTAGTTVHWHHTDIRDWQPGRRYDFWHDRAAFHFLTDPADQARYADILDKALAPGGHAVIATFAADGPETCSGLPVARYDADALARQFPHLRPVHAERADHRTPAGAVQHFTWLLLARRAEH